MREAWVGTRLPLACPHVHDHRGLGILTAPHNAFLQVLALLTGRSFAIRGYAVNAKAAVDALAQTDPAAAQWWRQNVPKLLDGRRNLVFEEEACEAEPG